MKLSIAVISLRFTLEQLGYHGTHFCGAESEYRYRTSKESSQVQRALLRSLDPIDWFHNQQELQHALGPVNKDNDGPITLDPVRPLVRVSQTY